MNICFSLVNCSQASFWCLFWINYVLFQHNSFEKYWIFPVIYLVQYFNDCIETTKENLYHDINNIARCFPITKLIFFV